MSTNSTVNDVFGINEDGYNTSYEIQTWDDLEINPNLLRGIYAYGFEKPSPIQQKAIKPLILKKDIIAQAQSGTGKTATFTIGALANVDITDNNTQILVLSPTKELTIQTAKVFSGLGGMLDGLRVKTVYGGSSFEENSSFSNKNVPHVICGCPGRVYDMMRRDKITSRKIKIVILDEADEMLSSGFKDQVYNIFQNFSRIFRWRFLVLLCPRVLIQLLIKL
jgi:translation initiation factor 4A